MTTVRYNKDSVLHKAATGQTSAVYVHSPLETSVAHSITPGNTVVSHTFRILWAGGRSVYAANIYSAILPQQL
jgi:hypothetical protein